MEVACSMRSSDPKKITIRNLSEIMSISLAAK